MSFESAQRDYENPPDEEEAVLCQDCGKELESIEDGYFKCTNSWCPGKFEVGSMERDLAEHIVELEMKYEAAQRSLKMTINSLRYVQGIREKLEAKLTPSQSNVVVRDTEYQITRTEDAIEFLLESETWDDIYKNADKLRKEWKEVKEILRQL